LSYLFYLLVVVFFCVGVVLDISFPFDGLTSDDVRGSVDFFDFQDIKTLMVTNGTDSDVEYSEEEEACFYSALAAVSAQFTDVFKEQVQEALSQQRANDTISAEDNTSVVLFNTAIQSYMSLCMDSLHPDILFRVQLRHTAEIVHHQFSPLFLEEVKVAVEKLCSNVAITQVERHKVDLYVTVFNTVPAQHWNHDVASSAPIVDSDPIAMEDIQEVNVVAKEEADHEAQEDISDRVTPNSTQLSPTGEEAHEGTSLTIKTSAMYHKGITSTTSSQDHNDVSINTSTRVLRSSRRHTKSITSPELAQVEQPSTPATELDEDYLASTHSSDDHYLDSDIETESSDESTTGDYQYQLLRYHREAFYDAFTPYYESMKSSTKLITNEKYDKILGIISVPKAKKESALIIKYRRLYIIVGNVERRCLYQQNKVVTTFENLCDVILEAHNRISHAQSTKSNLLCIKNTLGYYGVPFNAVKTFVQTCPLVHIFIISNSCIYLCYGLLTYPTSIIDFLM